MSEMREGKKRSGPERVERAFLMGFGFLSVLIVCICTGKPLHNLIPLRTAVYTLIWLGLLCVGRAVLAAVDGKLGQAGGKKPFRILFGVFIVVWAALLFAVGCVARSAPHTDYGEVYAAADALARGMEPDNWDYFSRWTNNRFPMLFLSALLRTGYLLGLKDAYYFVLAFQVLHVALTAGCVYYLAGRRDGEASALNSWTAMMLLVLLTPIWGNIPFFYTDQLSFGGSIIAYTLVYAGARQEGGRRLRRALMIGLGGLVWGTAFQLKVTAAIPLIAAGIVALLKGSCRGKVRNPAADSGFSDSRGTRQGPMDAGIRSFGSLPAGIKSAALFGACFLAAAVSGTAAVKALPCEKNLERDSEPVLYWVALGLNGDGSYGDNQDFAREIRQAENVRERKLLAAARIKSDWRNFFSPEHLISKARRNFACGDLGASGYMTYPYREGNVIYETISWDGKWFWKYACASTSYLFALFLLAALGAIRGAAGARPDTAVLCSFVALFGIILFLMLWEAQNKQLFNHSGWLILAAGYGLQAVGDGWRLLRTRAPKGRI